MRARRERHPGVIVPALALVLIVVAAAALPLFSAASFTTFDVYNGLQGIAGPGLLALGLGLTMIAGEFDLSTLGMYALGAMVAVQTGSQQPLVGALAACAVGIAFGAVQGYVIGRSGINSMALTLGSYVALTGLTGVLGSDDTVAFANADASVWVDQTLWSTVSPRSLIMIGAFALAALVLWRTRIGRHLRAVGGDRRASRSAGVAPTAVLTMVFACSGLCAGLGGALLGYSSATAGGALSLTPLIFAVTAVLLGGVSLSGGRGGAIGIAVGVLALGILNQIFAIQATPSYVADLVLGCLLTAAVAADAPGMRRDARRIVARMLPSRG